MNIALIIGKKNSQGLPGKNIKKILGRPAAEYAFIAAKYSGAHKIFVSTDSEHIASIGLNYNATHIERPAHLATPDALTEDALKHAYQFIKNFTSEDITTISLLFCNNPAIDVNLLKESISFLSQDTYFDSCVSIVNYDMFSPTRARKLTKNEEIKSFVDLKHFGNISSIRDSQGEVFFCDLSIQVLKPKCFEDMDNGSQPFQWHGNKIKGIKTDFGFDIDHEWQLVVIEHWLKKHGYTETEVPWQL